MRYPPLFNQYLASLYRFVLGLLIAMHGASSLFGVFGGSVGSGKSISATQWPGGVAADLQFAFGILVMFGLLTGISAVALSGTMAYAYFSVHQKVALLPLQNGGEQAALFSWGFLIIAVLGAGPLSLDALLATVRGKTAARPDTGQVSASEA
jgi:putative oxidoreductase